MFENQAHLARTQRLRREPRMIPKDLLGRQIVLADHADTLRPGPVLQSALFQRTRNHTVLHGHDLFEEERRIEAVDLVQRKLALVHRLDPGRHDTPGQCAREIGLALEVFLVVQNEERTVDHGTAARPIFLWDSMRLAIAAANSYRSASEAKADEGMITPIPLSIGRMMAFFATSTP